MERYGDDPEKSSLASTSEGPMITIGMGATPGISLTGVGGGQPSVLSVDDELE